jgi:prephenate dehydrogenase
MRIQTLAIVGVGLIGGSIGLAAKKRGLAKRVVGIGHRQATLEQALARGAVDEFSLNFPEAVREADLVVFCTPVDLIADQVLAAAPKCKPGALLTDAGSTKGSLVRRITDSFRQSPAPEGVTFFGSHPLAGSEKRGVEHADANLFERRLTIVTKVADSDEAALTRVVEFWRALGSVVHVMNPEEHDQALAITSHLPHMVATALVSTLTESLVPFTATGFRDTTRIAAGDPSLWTGILLQNREAILAGLNSFERHLAHLREVLLSSDRTRLDQLLEQAKRMREKLSSTC